MDLTAKQVKEIEEQFYAPFKKSKKKKYKDYELVFSKDRRALISHESFLESGDEEEFECAAILVYHNGESETKDMYIDNSLWVDCINPNYIELAIEKRKALK